MIYPISTLLLSNVQDITISSMHELASDSLKLRIKVLINLVPRSEIVSAEKGHG